MLRHIRTKCVLRVEGDIIIYTEFLVKMHILIIRRQLSNPN